MPALIRDEQVFPLPYFGPQLAAEKKIKILLHKELNA